MSDDILRRSNRIADGKYEPISKNHKSWRRWIKCEAPGCQNMLETYHKTVGKNLYCSPACRQRAFQKKARLAKLALALLDDPQRAQLMARVNVHSFTDLQPSQPKVIEPNLTAEEHRARDAAEDMRLAEIDDPNFIPSFAETWQCLECNKRWSLTALYCDCDNSPKPDNVSDF